jgi:hypothetical protein
MGTEPNETQKTRIFGFISENHTQSVFGFGSENIDKLCGLGSYPFIQPEPED